MIGIDIIELKRFYSARFLNRVADFVLTGREQELMKGSRDPIQYLASRFAAKEAVIKALPVKSGPLDFEILKNGDKPYFEAKNPDLAGFKVSVSLSHSEAFAAAAAVVI